MSFDPKCDVRVTPDCVYVMVEAYCLSRGTETRPFPIATVRVDAVSGTLSFYGLNWPWWKRGNTAICGWIGSSVNPLVAFDIQGKGSEPQTIPVCASFPGSVELDEVRFEMYADLTLPTDFRAALVFHRSKS